MGALLVLAGAYLGGGGFTNFFFSSVASQLIGNALAPRQVVEGPRLTDLGVQGSEYGQMIPICYGKVRLAGNIIWSRPIDEHVTVTGGGDDGCFGDFTPPQPEVREYSYTWCGAVEICDGPIDRIEKIWFDNELQYNYNGGTQQGYTFTYNGTTGTWTSDTTKAAKIRIYTGTETQLPDALIELDKGAGWVPANRGKVYIVFENIPIVDHIPLINVLVNEGTTDAADIAQNICERVGLTTDDFDFTDLSGNTVEGFVLHERREARAALELLQKAFFVTYPEIDGKITAVSIDTGTTVTLTATELNVAVEGQDNPLTESVKSPPVERPYEISIDYIDKNRDYELNTAVWRRQLVRSRSKESFSLPMVLSGAQARKMARTHLTSRWAEAESYDLSLPFKLIYLTPGDMLYVPTSDGNYLTRIETMNDMMFGPLAVQAVSTSPVVYGQPTPEDTGSYVETTVKQYSAPIGFIADVVSLNSDMAAKPGFIVANTSEAGYDWAGGYFASAGLGVVQLPYRATMGTLDTDLTVGESNLFDYDRTLQITMDYGTLATTTEANVRAGANALLIGERVIQFATADLISSGPDVYEISGLLDCRKGSDYTGTIASGAKVLLLTNEDGVISPAFKWVPVNSDKINIEYQYQFVSRAINGPATAEADFTVKGNSRRPLSVVRPRTERNGTDDGRILTWDVRTRLQDSFWRTGAIPEKSDPLIFDVVLKDGVDIMHTYAGVVGVDLEILDADLEEWYGSLPSTIDGEIYQVNGSMGRGFVRSFSGL